MNDWNEEQLPEELREVAGHLRAHRHRTDHVKLDELKRRALTQAKRASGPRQGRGLVLRSKIVMLGLVSGIVLSGGAAGVIAGGSSSGGGGQSAAKSEYKCNSGIGNESEQPPTPPSPDCDPGNSPPNNATNECEGPPTTQPPECIPGDSKKPSGNTARQRR